MTTKNAPSGATGSACLSDLVTLDRSYLDSIVALLRDPTACRGPGLMKIVDGFEEAIAHSDLNAVGHSASVGLPGGGYVTVSTNLKVDLRTAVAAVRSAFEPSATATDTSEDEDDNPEAIAEAKFAARDARRPKRIDAFINWSDGGAVKVECDAEQFAALVKSFKLDGRSLL